MNYGRHTHVPLITSGAMYLMVPTALVSVCSNFFAVPKSQSFNKRPSLKSKTLKGVETMVTFAKVYPFYN